MNMVVATVEEAGDGLRVAIGDQRLAVSPEALEAHPRLRAYAGRRVVLGVRPEDLEDAALVPDTPAEGRLRGRVMLSEALGSEINVHLEIAAPPVLTEDTRELAEDVGAVHHYQTHERHRPEKSKVVGRFNPRSRVKIGDVVEFSVDTRALHFFDLDSGIGIYTRETEKNATPPDGDPASSDAARGPSDERREVAA